MKNKTPVSGGVCKSVQGRDKDSYYVILEVSEGFVLVADGKLKKVSSPKRKNLKHVYLLPERVEEIANKLAAGVKIYDAEIISALKSYNIKAAK